MRKAEGKGKHRHICQDVADRKDTASYRMEPKSASKKNKLEGRETAQHLRALAALPQHLSSIPNTFKAAHNCL